MNIKKLYGAIIFELCILKRICKKNKFFLIDEKFNTLRTYEGKILSCLVNVNPY